ncbi:YidH family protein [Streptomyces sp. NPDC054933]
MGRQRGAGDTNPAHARDHLANERTYLAWLRTAANVMALGLAVAKFVGNGHARSLAAGALLMGAGAVGLVYSAVRYRRAAADIRQERLGAAGQTTGPLAAGVVLAVAFGAALLLLR